WPCPRRALRRRVPAPCLRIRPRRLRARGGRIRRGRGRRASTRVGSSCGGFPWREGADGERVDAVARNVAERAVDEALALKPVLAGEGCAFDDDGEMRFAAAIIAGMAVVACAVVDHFEAGRGERLLQQG